MGYFKEESSFVANISDECIIGLDTMRKGSGCKEGYGGS